MGSFSFKIRTFIYDRDENKCLKCGTPDNLTLDHIIPIAHGGGNEYTNLQTLCSKCNSEKGTKEIDYRKWLEYPAFINDEKFDWKLSLEEIDYRYSAKPKKKKVTTPISFSKILNHVWDGKMPQTHKDEMNGHQNSFTIHNGNKCMMYGKLNCRIGYGAEIGQSVYYDSVNDKLILEYAGTKISYHYSTLNKMVDKNEYKPKAKFKKETVLKNAISQMPLQIKAPKIFEFSELTTPKESVIIEKSKFSIEDYNKQPEPNFHY